MKLVIFGATGNTGRQVVQAALEQGHSVTAFVRNPAKLRDFDQSSLKVVRGDVMDALSVEQAIRGQDAVVCVLGAGKKLTGNLRSEGTRQIIQGMKRVGVRRLICQSTLGAGESWENLNFYWKYIMFGLILRKVFADHEIQEQIIKQSNLDWTIVRPGAFIEGEKTGLYRHGFSSTDKTIKLAISLPDLADFIVQQVADSSYLHQTPGVSY